MLPMGKSADLFSFDESSLFRPSTSGGGSPVSETCSADGGGSGVERDLVLLRSIDNAEPVLEISFWFCVIR